MKTRLLFILTCILSLQVCAAEKSCGCTPRQISKFFTAVAKKATPAVVYIKAQSSTGEDNLETDGPTPQDPFSDDFFNRFFGSPNKKMQKQPQISQGSGFFVSKEGHVLTNAHVVKRAGKITLILHDGREVSASVIGFDTSTDIAVLQAEGKDFPFVEMGDSDDLDVAEWVMAIGSPFQLQASVTVGVVSAKGRQNLRITDFEDFIQTDAAINPGNSGGPLLNLDGQVVGINTAIVSKSGGHLGIGFAIPSHMVQHIMKQIVDKGTVTRGFLGVALQPLDQDMADAFGLDRPEGALVAEVVAGSPAEKAGLKQGDIIVEYNGTPVKSIGSLRNDISMQNPGTKINLRVNRNGKLIPIRAILTNQEEEHREAGVIKKLGMEVEPLSSDLAKSLGYSPSEQGMVITKIKPGSAAASAGMRPGYLILAINHKKVTSLDEFNAALEETQNNRILILAKQGNVTRFYSLKVE